MEKRKCSGMSLSIQSKAIEDLKCFITTRTLGHREEVTLPDWCGYAGKKATPPRNSVRNPMSRSASNDSIVDARMLRGRSRKRRVRKFSFFTLSPGVNVHGKANK